MTIPNMIFFGFVGICIILLLLHGILSAFDLEDKVQWIVKLKMIILLIVMIIGVGIFFVPNIVIILIHFLQGKFDFLSLIMLIIFSVLSIGTIWSIPFEVEEIKELKASIKINSKYLFYIKINLPSLILIVIAIFVSHGKWFYIGALGWFVFVTLFLLFLDNSYKNKYNLKKIENMKWTLKRSANWLELHYSDQFERIVPINKGFPVEVMPKGTFRVGLIKDYDELVIVDLRPKQIKLDLTDIDHITTQDNVKLEGTISSKVSIRDNNDSILKLVSNEIEEDESLKSYLRIAIKTIISQYKWIEISILNTDTLSQIKNFISSTFEKIDLCFQVNDIIEINLSPVDKEFSEVLEKRQKEIENTKLKIEKLQAEEKAQEIIFEIEKKKIEKEFENKSITQEKQIELDEQLNQIEIKRKKESMEIDIQQKKAVAELDNNIFLERIKLLKDNIEALAVLNPTLYEKIRIAEIEAQKEKEIRIQRSQENLTKLIFDAQNARRAGIVDVISEIPIVQESIGMNIKQIISQSDESDLVKENERLMKEIESLKLKKTDEENINS